MPNEYAELFEMIQFLYRFLKYFVRFINVNYANGVAMEEWNLLKNTSAAYIGLWILYFKHSDSKISFVRFLNARNMSNKSQ